MEQAEYEIEKDCDDVDEECDQADLLAFVAGECPSVASRSPKLLPGAVQAEHVPGQRTEIEQIPGTRWGILRIVQ